MRSIAANFEKQAKKEAEEQSAKVGAPVSRPLHVPAVALPSDVGCDEASCCIGHGCLEV